MLTNTQFPADKSLLLQKILNEKSHFLCSLSYFHYSLKNIDSQRINQKLRLRLILKLVKEESVTKNNSKVSGIKQLRKAKYF